MVVSLAFCLELLLYPPKQISFSQQAIDVELVARGKQQTLLEDAELAQLELLLGVQEKAEVVADRKGIKSIHLSFRLCSCLKRPLQGIVTIDIITKTLLLDSLMILYRRLLMQHNIFFDNLLC